MGYDALGWCHIPRIKQLKRGCFLFSWNTGLAFLSSTQTHTHTHEEGEDNLGKLPVSAKPAGWQSNEAS